MITSVTYRQVTALIYHEIMRLAAMIVSDDWQEVAVLECILNDFHVGVSIERDLAVARQRLAGSKFDVLVVDRDLNATDLLCTLPSQHASLPVVVIARAAKQQNGSAAGKTFFIEKPISVDEAVGTLSAARDVMMASRLRHQPHLIRVPVALCYGKSNRITAELTNLSSAGLSVRAPQALSRRAPIDIRFRLPGLDSMVIATGELAWADNRGCAGLRFLEIPAHLQQRLEQWLEQRGLHPAE